MAATVTGKYANVYTRTGGNDSVNLATETPGVDADITAFRALTDMGNAGAIGIQLEGVTYVIPVLLNA
tara:strand:+ start:6715 stop:6918 length:204 start_codon:yes stop_codon:yes gene_type:complete